MKKSIFRSICLVAFAVFAASLVLIISVLYDYYSSVQRNHLKSQTAVIAHALENEGVAFFDSWGPQDYRMTWIDADGSVLYDNQSNADAMENHLGRAEVKAALVSGYGESTRYSTTLMQRQFYAAQRLSDGSVFRLSNTQLSALSIVLIMFQPILLLSLITAGLSLLLASRLSQRIMEPLNRLDPDKPENNNGYEELDPLLSRLSDQQRQLRKQESALKRRQDEFAAATNDMREGIVLLNDQGSILSINRTAARLLSVSSYCIGKDILLLNHSLPFQELLQRAKSGERAEEKLALSGGDYQINASPVVSDGVVSGIALLIFDVSEQEKAEKMRREFTANVSHELKTPLQTISGYAELMNGGLVKSEDVPVFSAHIYAEAQRMIALIEDIIRLSHLDEGAQSMKHEKADLYAICQSVLEELAPKAEAARVTLGISGGETILEGIPPLLRTIAFNLCDNAIKYNRKGGSVSVEVKKEKEHVLLSVSDTGIGIAPEHQERVFERFYRVDKSHSREIGGTGLGLSIVKHAAKLHNAEIKLQSVPNGGTSITVRFPV